MLALTALTVVLLVSIVGIVMVIVLLTLPAAIAGRFCLRMGSTMALAAGIFALLTTGLCNSRQRLRWLLIAIAASLGLMALLMTELGSVSHPQSRGKFFELLFEVVSAFGTVGLSTGVTGTLSPGGKTIIIFLMFLGRLGPMAVAVALTRPVRSRYYYVSEDIMIG